MKKLIYFTLGNNENYIELAKLCINSLYKNNYDGNFLFITDLKDKVLNSIKFKLVPYFLECNNSNLLNSSSNKLKIYQFDNINKFDVIIYSDLDILWTSTPDIIFNSIKEDKIYISNENFLISDEYWGGSIITNNEREHIIKNKISGMNAGIFAFNTNMINHFNNIEKFLNDNINLVNSCLEQPFLNVYLYRNNIYSTTLNNYVSHNGYYINEYNGVALHFAGGPGNFNIKYEKMINYYNKNLI
jgi:hypothetical protein